jgi:hypothetical protein
VLALDFLVNSAAIFSLATALSFPQDLKKASDNSMGISINLII